MINQSNGSQGQKFKFIANNKITGTQSIANGTYEIITGVDNNKALDVWCASKNSGANVQIYTRNSAMCQKVDISYAGDGYYTLQFRHSGKFLDVCGEGKVNGTNVWQWNKNGCDAQKWIIKPTGDRILQYCF